MNLEKEKRKQVSDTVAVLQGCKLRKDYIVGRRKLPVLLDISLEVNEGETVSIMGASGAGKSTLLHLLGGLDRPSGGRVLFEGVDIFKMSGARRARLRANRIGFVFQSYHLLPELDVLENVMLPAMTLRGAVKRASSNRHRAEQLLQRVGLADRKGHLPGELSGGEQQRVAIARALMNRPTLVLADEPTGNLDSVTGEQVLKCLFALTREQERTLVLVSHDPAIARRCDRLLSLKDGCLVNHNGS